MGDRVFRLEREIPRLNFCGDTSQYSHEYIQQEINQLRANLTRLFDAATAWRHGAEKLEALADRVWEVAHQLAEAWSSEESVQCQEALQRIERAARDLSTRSHQMHTFTYESAEVIEQAVNNFSTDSIGAVEVAGRVVGGRVAGDIGSDVMGAIGGAVDAGLGAIGIDTGPSKDEVAQRHLAALNQAYAEVNPLLPASVSVELPILTPDRRQELVAPPGGYAPAGFHGGGAGGAGIGGVGGGGAHLPAPDGVPGVPPTGGFSASDGVPEGYEWDGSTGGLAGATPLAPPAPGVGAGVGGGVTGVPPGPGVGGLPGPGAAGAAVPPGGVVPAGAIGGRAGGGLGAPGSRGVPGAGRPAVGMVGAPMGAGGAAGGGSGRGGAGRLGGSGGVVGRGGVAGGVVPMGSGAAGGGGGRGGAARPGGPGGVAGRGGVAGGMVPMGAGARGAGQDGAGRDTWLVEDEDPWGTDDRTPPSVIE